MPRRDLGTGLLVLVLSALVFASIVAPCAMAKDDNDHGAAGIAVDLAKAMITEKDVAKGLAKYAEEKYDKWMWDSVGGYENLVAGRLTGEAYITQIREKVTKATEIIEAIENFARAMGAGAYDEAAFIAIDQAVGAVDHPLVSLTWEMAKLTYESHKAVQETGAALLVEGLYGALHRDRRLFGSQDGEVAQIPEDSQTVDYFFDKYIVTDAGTREMVKAYVQTRLGEEWPEQSWSSWLSSFRAIGAGVDVAEAEETEALTGEWRNVARKWILSIIRDVNSEARKWYHMARLNQQKAAFEAFAAQYKAFGYELPRLLEMYGNAARIRANLASYHDLLAKDTATLQKTESDLSKMSPVNPAALNQLHSDAIKYKREAMNCRADMLTINEFTLAGSFERLEGQWSLLAQQIGAKMPPPPSSAGDAIQASPVGSGWGDDYDARVDSYVAAYFADLLQPIPVPDAGEIEAYRAEFLERLNSRESTWNLQTSSGPVEVYSGIDLAEEVRSRWNRLRPSPQYVSRRNLFRDPGYKPLWDAIEWRMAEVAERVGPDHILTGGTFYSLLDSVGTRVREIYHNVVYPTAYAYFDDLDRWMAEQVEAAAILRQTRANQYAALMSLYTQVHRQLTQMAQVPDGWIGNPHGDPIGLDLYLAEISRGLYTHYTGIDYDTYNLAYSLDAQVRAILGGWSDGGYNYWSERANKLKAAVDQAEKLLGTIETLSPSEIDEIRSFVAESRDIGDIEKLRQAVSVASSYASSMPTLLSGARQMLDTDYNNRKADADWLRKISNEWQIWVNSQLQLGYMERSGDTANDIFILRLPEGMAFARVDRVISSASRATDGMIMTVDPYPHLMMDAEILSLAAIMRARGNWSASSAYRFITQYAPETAQRYDEMLQFRRMGNYPDVMPLIKSAEPNFVHPHAAGGDAKSLVNSPHIVWESDLKRAIGLLENLSYRDRDYEKRLTEIRDLLPATLAFASAAEQTDYRQRANRGELVDYSKMGLMLNDAYRTPKLIPETSALQSLRGIEVGEMYIRFCDRLQEVISQERRDREEALRKESERRALFYPLADQARSSVDSVQRMIDFGDYANALQYEGNLQLYTNQLRSLPGPDPDSMVTDALSELRTLIGQAREKLAEAERRAAKAVEQIRAFYDAFSRAYESRNTGAVLRLIDDSWEAPDGSDARDLEDTLDRNFRVYDEIRYKVSNVKVLSDLGEGKYLVSYELSIVSRIFRRNLKHEENSAVEEEIRLDSRGAGKIILTRKGRFWR